MPSSPIVTRLSELLQLRLVRYVLSGGTAFVCEYGSFLALYHLLHISAYVSASSSFIIGLLVSFALNRSWAFNSATEYHYGKHQQALVYGVVAAVNILATNLIIAGGRQLHIDPTYGKIIAMAIIAGWNFFIFKHIVFRQTRTAGQGDARGDS